jgi:hypothetical protein
LCVGTEDFTPPELHGVSLSSVQRTQAHDHFGLAVAIFQLLIMGKHPDAGRFSGSDLSLGQSIAQNRFAFSVVRRDETRTTPPPGSVLLGDFPPPIAAAFEAAFGLAAASRPDPAVWVKLFQGLENTLRQCANAAVSKSYVGSWSLLPTLTRGTFDEYQRLIGAVGSLDAVSAGVAVESTQVDATSIRHPLFAQIHRAMRLGRCIRVLYRSMSNPEAHERVIRPHSFIQAGPRWHIRAYCSKAEAFRDLNLGRISAATVFNVRAPIAKYLIQSFRAAIDPERERAPEHLFMVYQPEELPAVARWC